MPRKPQTPLRGLRSDVTTSISLIVCASMLTALGLCGIIFDILSPSYDLVAAVAGVVSNGPPLKLMLVLFGTGGVIYAIAFAFLDHAFKKYEKYQWLDY